MVGLTLCVTALIVLPVLLLTSLRLVIDSYHNVARASWGKFITVSLTEQEGDLVLRLWAFGWKRDWGLLKMIAKRKPTRNPDSIENTSRKPGKRRRLHWSFRRVLRILKSFRVHAFRLDLDTDDYVLNAYLFPVAEMLRYRGVDVFINFNGNTGIRLDVSNNPARILVAWLK
jgi:hypothetical protein